MNERRIRHINRYHIRLFKCPSPDALKLRGSCKIDLIQSLFLLTLRSIVL